MFASVNLSEHAQASVLRLDATITDRCHVVVSPGCYSNDDEAVGCSPSTVCSVLTTTTTAHSPLKALLTAPPTPSTPSACFEGSIVTHHSAKSLDDIADVVARCVVTSAQAQASKKPMNSDSAQKMTDAVHGVAHSLLASGCTTPDELSLACVLIKRAARSDTNPQGIAYFTANVRRVLVSAVRLCAKAHSDEYYSIATMCAAAELPTSTESFKTMAECEWKLFVALEMNCAVSCEELSKVFSASH